MWVMWGRGAKDTGRKPVVSKPDVHHVSGTTYRHPSCRRSKKSRCLRAPVDLGLLCRQRRDACDPFARHPSQCYFGKGRVIDGQGARRRKICDVNAAA